MTERWPVGTPVTTWWDTGAFGLTVLRGRVVASGPQAALIEWESGLRNRIRWDDRRGVERAQEDT